MTLANKKGRDMTLALPVELLIEIISQMSRHDLKNLCEVSKLFYGLTVPILYKSIVIKSRSEYSLEKVDTELLLRAPCEPMDALHSTKDFLVTSSFHEVTDLRCLHYKDPLDIDTDDDSQCEDDDDFLGRLEDRVIRVLQRFKDGQLRSFSWELGTCIPDRILGFSGYLPAKQNKIESVRLITDVSCRQSNNDLLEPPTLSSFQSLKSLSWTGLSSQSHFEALQETFRWRAHQLQELELDLIEWDAVERDSWAYYNDPDNFFAQYVLGLSRGDQICMFPSLRVLSLSVLSFQPFEEEMAYAFGFSRLHSLKLRLCQGWEGFLAHAERLNPQICLKSLEVQSTLDYDDDFNEGEQLLTFLRAFHGLEELFVSTSAPSSAPGVWCAALNHKATLRRFVHHQRTSDIDDESVNFEEDYDSPDLSFVPEDLTPLTQDPSQNPLASFDLECFGVCCTPRYLAPLIAPLAAKHLMQVLHLRSSGSDLQKYKSRIIQQGEFATDNGERFPKLRRRLHKFAEWIFGPEGFPSMKVLAAGDFSHRGQFSETNVILCRREEPAPTGEAPGRFYRYAKKSDTMVWSLLDRYSNVLAACPTDAILECVD